MSRKLLLNSFSGTAAYAVSIVVAFIMSPVYIRALGNRDYGLWELVMSVIGYMGLLDLGIGGSLVRFVSVADGRRDKNDLQRTISTAFVFFVCVGAVAVVSFFILSFHPGFIAGSEEDAIESIGIVFMLLGINAGMLFPLQVFVATLMGMQRHYYINTVRTMLLITRAGLAYYLLLRYQGHGLIIMALLEPMFTVMQFVLLAGAVYLDKNIPKMVPSAVSRSKAKEMIIFGVKSVTMLVASRLQNQSVPLIITHVMGLGQIVYFILPNRLVGYAKDVSQAIGFPLTPYFGAAIGKGDHGELVKSWLNTTLALQIVSLAMPIVLFFYGETFLGLWIGQEYASAGRVVLYILLAGLAADSLATNAFRMLTAMGQHGRTALLWLVFSALSIPIGIWGTHLWGIAGVAAGTTAVTVVANIFTIYMACLIMQVSVGTYFRKTLLRVIVPLLILSATLWWLGRLDPARTYLDMVLHLLTGGCIYVVAVWFFSLSKNVRKILMARLGKMFQRRTTE